MIQSYTCTNKQLTVLQSNALLASTTLTPLPQITDPNTINYARQIFEAAGIALIAGDTIIVPAIAAASGTYLLYRGGKVIANVVKEKIEFKQQQRAIGYDNPATIAGTPNPLPPKRDDEDERGEEKKTSTNQMRQKVEKGQAPKEITRFDKGSNVTNDPSVPKEQAHIHFGDNIALNFDGTMKHGTIDDLRRVLTNDGKRWLRKMGVKLPPNLQVQYEE